MEVLEKNIKTLALIILVFLALSIYFNASQYSSNKKLKFFKKNELERLKEEQDSIILVSQEFVDSVRIDNQEKDIKIRRQNLIIDSLRNKKDSVRVVYETIYKEIESFNSKQLEDYWKNVFKNAE